MQGACIVKYENPVLIMYKEIEKNLVLFVIYYNNTVKYNYISCKDLTNIIPVDAHHILTKLPYYGELELTLRFWKIIAYTRLKNKNII